MSVFHQERTGFDHRWTRILCIYSAGVCPFHLVASFKFGNLKSNVKSVERRGINFVFISLISFRFVSFLLSSFRFVSFSLISFRFVSISFRTLYRRAPKSGPSHVTFASFLMKNDVQPFA
jgi:hypothetical protein